MAIESYLKISFFNQNIECINILNEVRHIFISSMHFHENLFLHTPMNPTISNISVITARTSPFEGTHAIVNEPLNASFE